MARLKLANILQPSEYYHVASVDLSAGQSDKPGRSHSHDFHELFWVEEGKGWHCINGERRELRFGDLVLIRAPDVHTFSVAKGGTLRIFNVAFHCRTWSYLRLRYFQDWPDPFSLLDVGAREYFVEGADSADLRRAGREIAVGHRSRAAIERFLLNLFSRLSSNTLFETKVIPDWLKDACRGICEPPVFTEGAPAFARLAGRSPEHVAREVRRLLNKTPTDIVNEARLAYAASRLCGSDDKIVNVALDCGFENLGHFYRLFGAKFGVSPRHYRLQQQIIMGQV